MAGVARRYLNSQADIDDAVQDAWLSFVRFQHTVLRAECVSAWLCVTAGRAALGIAKRASRCTPSRVRDDTTLDQPWVDDHDQVDEPRRSIAVDAALSRLPTRDRRLLELLMNDDPIPYATISNQIGCPIGSIGPTRGRILAKLRDDVHIRALVDTPA